jgi:hypothetical protein
LIVDLKQNNLVLTLFLVCFQISTNASLQDPMPLLPMVRTGA